MDVYEQNPKKKYGMFKRALKQTQKLQHDSRGS